VSPCRVVKHLDVLKDIGACLVVIAVDPLEASSLIRSSWKWSFATKELCMKKSKFTEEQMVRILKEVVAGAKVAETCREHGISEPTYYVWKSKYAGMEVSQLRHLQDVKAELARMKRMYAELVLDHHALKDVLSRKG